MKSVIKNVEVWHPDRPPSRENLAIEAGRFVRETTPDRVVDGTHFFAIPAGVDPQVHLRYPGGEHKETPESAIAACLRGGIGCVLAMPNTQPTIDHVDILNLAQAAFKDSPVRVLWTVAITKGLRGKENVDYASMPQIAAITDDGVGVVDDARMEAAFAWCEKSGVPLLQHAEYPGHGAVLAAGPVQESIGSPAYPAEAEWTMVERDLRLLRKYSRARYHVLHVSSQKTIDLVRQAKSEGLRVSCEVSPHHLWFTADDVRSTAFKMNPPLRSRVDRDALRQALSNGGIDFVATDHAPHEETAKGENYKTAAFGTTGLESSLRVLLALYQEGILTAQRLVQVFSQRPAAFLGQSDAFGVIGLGRPANFVLVDRQLVAQSVTVEDLKSLSKNHCFLGEQLPTAPSSCWLDGKVCWQAEGSALL